MQKLRRVKVVRKIPSEDLGKECSRGRVMILVDLSVSVSVHKGCSVREDQSFLYGWNTVVQDTKSGRMREVKTEVDDMGTERGQMRQFYFQVAIKVF